MQTLRDQADYTTTPNRTTTNEYNGNARQGHKPTVLRNHKSGNSMQANDHQRKREVLSALTIKDDSELTDLPFYAWH